MKTMAGVVLLVIARAFFSCLVLKVARRPKTLRMPMFSWFHGAKTWISKKPHVCVFLVLFRLHAPLQCKMLLPVKQYRKNLG